MLVLETAATCLATSLDIFIVFDFLRFFRRAFSTVQFDTPSRGGEMKSSAAITAGFRPSGCGSIFNRVEGLVDALGLNCNDLWKGPCRSWKAVLLGVFGLNHLGVHSAAAY